MTPAARAAAAIDILDQILSGIPAEAALLRWSRGSRFAGSGDRAAVRDLVFDSLRCKLSRAARGGGLHGRGLILGMCREQGLDPATIFSGKGHAPAALTPVEAAAGAEPDGHQAMDLPDWVWPDWRAALGDRAEVVALAMRERAPVWLRANRLRATPAQAIAALSAEGIEAEPAPDLPTALRVISGARRLSASRAYQEGLVELQDLSPQLACAALPPVRHVLDYCAGGGGKSLALAAAGAEVTAHDADAGRMADLPARAKRAGATIRVAQPGSVRGSFDMVVTDVPCSGSGTWRRTPDAKWRMDMAMVQKLATIQADILDRAAAHVGAQGYLAYMTCSVLERENSLQIRDFIARHDFELLDQRLFLPPEASDGFYLALMRRC
ncbi:RsmB/NOP family class I SAM-dependent RNA methyltransferase [Paracoccus laeviglucosivorans]|uniref:16S rRNA (Cytosine967-C5)-methyltransferase n=1 Tax=Paracoccus laeviglucosivorans TaxID=1197861 RepID=A0A521APC7_9RHOB|nr:RsmB/NOP family class I SAM-dependent RNA methyltransferase [Paracoccus laeviglucosivorans]SMO36658.1 16S rRNA (cytosine967-C5)-methyltransferase [Paracoccus laeviglucosivorans]